MTTPAPPRERMLEDDVAAARWYHTIELPGGIRTPGDYDTLDVIRRIPFPESLEGKRCLDVGTRDGFFAFEMERRGAAEVIAIDLDDPNDLDYPEPRPAPSRDVDEVIDRRNDAFRIAHRALGSRVERVNLSVYDLDPAEVGRFDFAFAGTILLHLRSPFDALTSIRRVLAPDGRFLSNDAVSIPLTLVRPRRAAAEVVMEAPRPFFYVPNAAGRAQLVRGAGFEVISRGRPYLFRYGAGWERQWHARSPGMIVQAALLHYGAPHTAVLAKPVG